MQEIKGNNNLQVFGDLTIEKRGAETQENPLTDYQWKILRERVEAIACEEYQSFKIYTELMAEFAVDRTRDIPSHFYSDANLLLDKIEEKINKIIDENKDLKLKSIYIARIMQMPNLSEIQEYSIRKFGTSYFHNLKTDEVDSVLSYFESMRDQENSQSEPEKVQETFFSRLIATIRTKIDL